MPRWLPLIMLSAVLAACSSPTTPAATSHTGSALTHVDVAGLRQRPVRLPSVASGQACPTSSRQPARRLDPQFGTGAAFGQGPIYPLMAEASSTSGRLPLGDVAGGDGGWAASKVLWIASPAYRGDQILVRGRQLNGPHELRFGLGANPSSDLVLTVNTSAAEVWSNWPSETRWQAPACYGYQVDGAGISETIVFEVVD